MEATVAAAFAVVVGLGAIPVVALAWVTNQLQKYLPAHVRGLAAGLIPALLATVYLMLVNKVLRRLSKMSECQKSNCCYTLSPVSRRLKLHVL
jgi:hypothetical protein